MKIRYRLLGLNPRKVTDQFLNRHLEALDRLIPITWARVVLAQQRAAAPSFSASVELAVPGPDIHAAACDHTLEAAVLKVARRLEAQVAARKKRQQSHRKGREQCRRVPARNRSS